MRFSRICFLCCALASVFVSAEDVWTRSVRVASEDGGYYAVIADSTSGVTDLEVYKTGGAAPLWSSWLDWGGDYTGYLSNDGTVFVALNAAYADTHNLATVYYRTKQEAYTVKSIPLGREFLRRSGSKYLWLSEGAQPRFAYGSGGAPLSLELKLADGRTVTLKFSSDK